MIVDSSTRSEAIAIQDLCQKHSVNYLPGPKSVRCKRNIGVRSTKGDLLLFVDSDCSVSHDIYSEHARIYIETPDTAGVCGLTCFVGHDGLHQWVVEKTGLTDAFSFAKKYDRVQWCTTSNLSLQRQQFEKIGGFEEDFPFKLGGDDLDLTYRITRNGGIIRSNPKAVVYHSSRTWKGPVSIIMRALRWGRMSYHIIRRHNELQFFDLTKPLLVFILFILLLFARMGLKVGPPFINFVLLFAGSFLIVRIVFLDGRGLGWKRIILPIAWGYTLAYHLGVAFEFIRHGNFRFMYQRMVFSNYQLANEWRENVSRQWIMILCFILAWLGLLWTLK